jgi:murein DD-endopeptidase MepM/ murein hydrolase activator NlpD
MTSPIPASPPAATALLGRLSATLLLVVVWSGSVGAASAIGESAQQGVWPLDPAPTVVRRFDPPGVPWGAGHRGVDLAARPGMAVHSAMSGRISFSGVIAGVPVVVVDDGTLRNTYQPVTASWETGTAVASGTVIGTVAATGSHCAPELCLHWGLIRDADGAYLDPLSLVGARVVRLLPLWRDLPETTSWGGGA